MRYVVIDNHDHAVRVVAKTADEAALRGATKLGMRWAGRRPGRVQQYAEGSASWIVYGPYDDGSNGWHVMDLVYVYDAKSVPPRQLNYV
jgi:hypothetical protein